VTEQPTGDLATLMLCVMAQQLAEGESWAELPERGSFADACQELERAGPADSQTGPHIDPLTPFRLWRLTPTGCAECNRLNLPPADRKSAKEQYEQYIRDARDAFFP